MQQVKSNPIPVQTSHSDQHEALQPSSTSQDLPTAQSSTSGFTSSALAVAYNCTPKPDTLDIEPPQSDTEYSDTPADSDEGEISSDTLEKLEKTEDMNYSEIIRSVHSFMGWNHIPTFESDLGEPDTSNNPWKWKTPKRPARISVAMPLMTCFARI